MEHALAGAGLVREVLWGLACPVHCGGSSIPYLLLGLLCGFVLGIVLTLVTLWTFVNIQRHPVLPQHSPSSAPSASPSFMRRRSRLSGYLANLAVDE